MDKAVVALIILAVVIVFLILEFVPSAATVICGCVAMVIFGVCDVETVAGGLSNDLVLIIFGRGIIGAAVQASSAAEFVGKTVARLARGNERLMIVGLALIAAAFSAFMNSTIVSAMMLTICMGDASGNSSTRLRNLSMPVIIGTIMGGTCTVVGAAPQIFASGYLAEAEGISLGFFSTTLIGIPVLLAGLLYMAFIGYPLGRRIWGGRPEEEIERQAGEPGQKLFKKADFWKTVAILSLVVGLSVSRVCSVGSAAVLGGMLCILTGVITQKEAFRQMSWNTLFWMAGSMGITAALTASGANELAAGALKRLLRGFLDPWILLALVTLAAMAVSIFIADVTTVIIMLPIVLSVISGMGLNPVPYTMGVVFGASIGFATPLSNGFLGMAMSSGYRFKDYIWYGLPVSILSYLVCIVMIPVVYPLM